MYQRYLKAHFLFTVALVVCTIAGNAQMSYDHDTIRIKEVTIPGKKVLTDISAYKKLKIDSSAVSDYSHETLAELLVKSSNIFIKSYGSGGTATTSFRGTGASHTQLQWNNINMNNPMLGQPDLSLIPAGLIDEIEIHYGGSSMPYGTGGIGGMINLGTKPSWTGNTSVSINPGIGSFGQYSGLVRVRTGNQVFHSVTKAYIHQAENNFSYLNTVSSSEPVWEIRRNNQIARKGFLQELYYRKSRNVLSARLWYQTSERNLPSSILIHQPDDNEKQNDESVRTIIEYDGHYGLSEYFLTGSYSVSRLDYSNKLASIDSRNFSEMIMLRAKLVNRTGRFLSTKVVAENENTHVRSVNYDDNSTRRNVTSVTGSAEVNVSGRLGASFLLRETLHESSFLTPDFSTGMKWQITDGREYYFKANYSRNSRIPSMNDLFWSPGGNTSLLNESANMFEAIYEMNQKISSPLQMKLDLSLYVNTISNMIQWLPGEYSWWVAGNVKSVSTSGLESALQLNYILNKISSTLNLSYAYTRATATDSDIPNDASVGKQLVYVPENQANIALKLNYLNFYSSWLSGFTGRRYTTADNSSFLPSNNVNSFSAGYSVTHRNNLYNASLNVDNILNAEYETIAYYPQPGRAFSLKLLIQFIK
jgi:iron complex outermembrane receptor protein